MEYISERIINISDYEKKISDAKLYSEQLMRLLKSNELQESIKITEFLNENLKQLKDFEFIIEHRKISRLGD